MDDISRFEAEKAERIKGYKTDAEMRELCRQFLEKTVEVKYSYNFNWLGLPIIQYPQDIVAMQEIIWEYRPELIVETGIARGGSIIFYASMLDLLGGDGRVIGVDLDIRQHNREKIEAHAFSRRVEMIQGSSVDVSVIGKVFDSAKGSGRVLVVLDSNHTRDHVLAELHAYSPLVKKGGYMVVFDTFVENLPDRLCLDRPWGKGDNPMTAVNEFMKQNDRFVLVDDIEDKLMLTVAPGGYLRCVKD